MPSAVRGHASTTTETIASGTQRYKFFRRPIMPKVSVVPPGILLAPTAQGENNPLEPIVNPPEAVTRDAEIQTMYRESEAQTVPYAPEYVIPNGQSPELLLLQNLRYDDGLPLGEKEIAMIEYARAKQDMEVNLPPFTDEASLILRKKLMEQQEMREFKMREIEIDQARHERVKKIEMALAEREESNDFMTSQRLESIRLLRMEEREKVLQKIRNKRIKALRRIAYQRNAADPVLSEGTKKDIIDSYFDRGSEVYAPIKRAGKEVAADPTKFDVEKRTVPLDTINNIVSLEYTIPRHIVDESDGAVSPPIFSKTMPVGAGHRMRDSRNTIKAAEPRLTSAAQRSLRMTKRDVEEMHQILMQKKTSSASLTHIAAPTTTGSPPLSPGKHSAPASPSRRGGPPPPTGTLAAKKPKGRPPSPDLTRDRDLGATADDAKLRADHEFQLAVTLLQRLIRGRAVQNIMFEGKYRRRELISELKSADTADAKLRDATDEEILAMEKVHREERIRDTSLEAVAGVVSSNMLHLLAEEKARTDMIHMLQLQANMAMEERRKLEAMEAGRRQRNGLGARGSVESDKCGLTVENLLVEYGEKNFRLTRCSHCGQVADKYIECELLLVLLDVFLHRKPAFRHLMFNRYHPVVAHRAVRWMSVVLLIISLALQLIVLRHTQYRRVNIWTLLVISLASVCELSIFSSTIILYILYHSSFQSIATSYVGSFTRLFLCILFPEVFRVVAIILYMFDSHADLLILISLLVLSVQLVSIHSTTNLRWEIVIGGLVIASSLRLLLLRCFYSSEDIWTLGGFT